MLKAELLYLSKMNCFNLGRFSTVGSQGRTGLSVGAGSVLVTYSEGHGAQPTSLVLVHVGMEAGRAPASVAATDAGVKTGHSHQLQGMRRECSPGPGMLLQTGRC